MADGVRSLGRRRRLLVLSFFPCFEPPRSGGESRLFNLYMHLAERFEVLLLSTADGEQDGRVTHSPWFAELRLTRGAAYDAAFAAAREIGSEADLSAVSVGAAGACPAALHAAFLAHHAWADVIVHESPFTLPYDLLIGLDAKPRVYGSHNAEAALMRAMHPGAAAAPIHALADACERALVNAADLVMVCAEGDRAELERTAGRALPRLLLVPNGALAPSGPPRTIAPAAARLLFVGSGHQPNVDAARFLVDRAMPDLPGLELHVAGACLPPGRPAANVVCHGEVTAQALAALVAASDVALNPMRTGGGSNLKVLDYMAAGLPVVATAFGMRGAFAEPGRHYVQAGPDGFADAVAALAADPAARARLSAEGVALVRDRLTWGAIARDAGDALDGLRPRRRPAHVLWLAETDPAEAADGARSLALLRALGGHSVVLCRHAGERIERIADGAGLTTIRLPRSADGAILRGLYGALRHGARRIVVASAALAPVAASFGKAFDYAPDAADAALPMDGARAFCVRNAARLVAASAADGVGMSAVRTDQGGPLPVIPSAAEAASFAPPAPARRRLLLVTYRWTEPPLGGAEVMLRELLARLDGWDVDVVCADVGSIANEDRFACVYGTASGLGAPPGLPRTSWRRFPLAPGFDARAMERAWEVQAAFDRAVAAGMEDDAAHGPRLLAGWGRLAIHPLPPRHGNGASRWTSEDATFHAGSGGALILRGVAPRATDVTITAAGATVSARVDGAFSIEAELPPGEAAIRAEARAADEPETGPGALRVTHLGVAGESLLAGPTLAEDAARLPFDRRVALLDRAARASRFPAGVELTRLRGPHSPELARWVREHVAEYDVVLAQNCVFRPAIDALAEAAARGVPSVFLPHVHLDDDFYHFPDIARAFRQANVSLVSPRAAAGALARSSGADVRYFAAGGVSLDEFAPGLAAGDVAAYRAALPGDGRPELLVLGRKAGAKNYRAAFEARRLLEARGVAARVVMIGPDDDGAPVDEPGAAYLGSRPRDVVRGALRSARILVNMSASESFGIVLLEAWLGGCPVIANRGCGAFADLVQDGVNGFLADGPAEVADRAATLIADPALAARMAKAGRAVASGLTWARQAAELRAVCDELADRRG